MERIRTQFIKLPTALLSQVLMTQSEFWRVRGQMQVQVEGGSVWHSGTSFNYFSLRFIQKTVSAVRQQEMSPFSNMYRTHPLAQAPPTAQALQQKAKTLIFYRRRLWRHFLININLSYNPDSIH